MKRLFNRLSLFLLLMAPASLQAQTANKIIYPADGSKLPASISYGVSHYRELIGDVAYFYREYDYNNGSIIENFEHFEDPNIISLLHTDLNATFAHAATDKSFKLFINNVQVTPENYKQFTDLLDASNQAYFEIISQMEGMYDYEESLKIMNQNGYEQFIERFKL